MARRYEQKKRAETAARTREKIVRAAVDLHGTLGPAQTTISAIAEKAGVRRATVYEHFPDERSIFEACTAHFFGQHPPPDYHRWAALQEPVERFAQALTDTYAYYQRTEPTLALGHRDAQLKPIMAEVEAVRAQAQHWQAAAEVLLELWSAPAEHRPLLRAAVGHAMDFQTWQSLVRAQGLTQQQAVELMVQLVRCSVQHD